MLHAPNGGQRGLNKNEWAVILAGGDGTRLKTLTRRIAGDERPKQFCHILAGKTLLEQTRQRVALHAETPEVEYGWIEPADPIFTGGWPRMCGVRRFWEKPDFSVARVLQARGCLWNSFVMIAPASALLEVIASAAPDLYNAFAPVRGAIGSPQEAKTIEDIYRDLKEANFSHQVLASRPERLAVLEVSGVRWNDLGEPRRVMASLRLEGLRPHWVESSVSQPA